MFSRRVRRPSRVSRFRLRPRHGRSRRTGANRRWSPSCAGCRGPSCACGPGPRRVRERVDKHEQYVEHGATCFLSIFRRASHLCARPAVDIQDGRSGKLLGNVAAPRPVPVLPVQMPIRWRRVPAWPGVTHLASASRPRHASRYVPAQKMMNDIHVRAYIWGVLARSRPARVSCRSFGRALRPAYVPGGDAARVLFQGPFRISPGRVPHTGPFD